MGVFQQFYSGEVEHMRTKTFYSRIPVGAGERINYSVFICFIEVTMLTSQISPGKFLKT